jgi:CubicO group peptidase (beta-lactamase class C family)
MFHMASISKPFVATAIMRLAEAGKLELDARVTRYLPYFRIAGAGADGITLRQLLSHTAGMPDADDYGWHRPEHDEGALERYVRSLADEALIALPGRGCEYSNMAFEVLGDVIAKVSGQSFEAHLKTQVLAPLGMHNSSFFPHEVPPALATVPHLGLPPAVLAGAYPYHRAHAPSSTLHSSVLEMSRWALAHLAQGTLDGQRLLSPRSHAELWQRQADTGEPGWEEAAALGWFLGTYRGRRVVSHDGGDPGFETNLVLLPDDGMALVVLSNCNTAPISAITNAALDVLLGSQPQAPEPPIVVPVATALAGQGCDAAVALYRAMTDRPNGRDLRPSRFEDAVWGAIELHRPQAVRALIELWVELEPEASEAHTMLGWADLVDGNHEGAAVSLRRALELDPDNKQAGQFLAACGQHREC